MSIVKIIFLGLLTSTNLIAQNDSNWYVKYDSLENCGYVDNHGKIMIPFGKYNMCFTDTFRTYAIVSFKDKPGFFGIDKMGNELFMVYPFDNGPDYTSDGTFRIIENSKMGIADTTGKIIIPPVYDFTFGFENGLALVNIGGHKEKIDTTDPNCEYYTWTGGLWGIVNKKGLLILDIKYLYSRNHETNKIKLTGQKDQYEIFNGQLIKK